jgi:tetratricopeptide (TPR) repeat protein
MRYRIILLVIVGTLAGAAVAADEAEGPSMSDLNLLTAPSAELPPGDEDLVTKLQFARAFILSGKPDEALELLDEVQAKDLKGSFTVECLYYRGFALDVKGNYAAALVNYAEALERRPGDATILLAQGQTYLDKGDGDQARASFEAALAASPNNSQALTGLGYLYLATGDFPAAKEKLAAAVAADATNALALSYLGLLEMNDKDFEPASAHLEAAVALEPKSLTANYNLAGILFMQKDYAGAEEHYRAVLERKPDDGQARFYLALALEAQGRFDDALAEADAIAKSDRKVEGLIEMVDRLERKKAAGKDQPK